jgi:GNAT superfamily N-acetyltransferase
MDAMDDLPDISALRDTEAELAAQWIYQEWARFESAETWAQNRRDIADALDPAVRVPKFFGARLGGELAGIASIVLQDLPTRPDLGPWLANVLVLPAWRRRGIGGALVKYVMDYAAPLHASIYLYTFDQVELYQRLGWQTLEQDRYVDRPITLMRYPPG